MRSSRVVDEIETCCGWYLAELWMRSGRVVRTSDSQCQVPGSSGTVKMRAVDEAVLWMTYKVEREVGEKQIKFYIWWGLKNEEIRRERGGSGEEYEGRRKGNPVYLSRSPPILLPVHSVPCLCKCVPYIPLVHTIDGSMQFTPLCLPQINNPALPCTVQQHPPISSQHPPMSVSPPPPPQCTPLC